MAQHAVLELQLSVASSAQVVLEQADQHALMLGAGVERIHANNISRAISA